MRACLLLTALALAIAGCASAPSVLPERWQAEPKIADVLEELPELELEPAVRIEPTRREVMEAYERVYGRLPAPQDNYAIGKRLADLEMAEGEDRDIDGLPEPYASAIERYELLLEAPEGAALDAVIYQLARAYDLGGNSTASLTMLDRLVAEYPDSPYIPEARFRRAEIHFSANRYEDAAQDYRFVLDLGEETPYFKNAGYMLGWSDFKQSNLDESLTSFFKVVDDTLEADVELATAEQELLDDSFRAIVLALEYLDGPDTLSKRMAALDRPDWQWLAYERLAADYVEKERFLDSSRTWLAFVADNPLNPKAPVAQRRLVDTLIAAEFPSDAHERKDEFVRLFGVHSEFYAHHEAEVFETYSETLHTYLTDLAKAAHADAQALAEADKPAVAQYLETAAWYEEFVLTFPDDPELAEQLFLLGEVYTEAREPMQAVAAYQRVVRDHVDYEKAPEAGYGAVIELGKALENAIEEERELIQRLQIDAQIEFALQFSDDARAPAVQLAAANSLFDLAEFDQAVQLAATLLEVWTGLSPQIQESALLIVGHGQFELGNYVAAEEAYDRCLRLQLAPEVRSDVQERLLAAVFKQGEAAEADGDPEEAVEHYLRIAGISADAELAVKGHYDAIAVVESGGDLARAAELLESLRTRYPEHELVADAGLRLANFYEGTEDWLLAARELAGIADAADNEDALRRQSRFRAAELYLQEQQLEPAASQFALYAQQYRSPADVAFEAMEQLDQIYEQLGDSSQRRRWLREKIALHEEAGDAATERMTARSADASYFFALEDKRAFEALALSIPLAKSLRKKQQALSESVSAFEGVASYQVPELQTAATFHIADLYTHLAVAIMRSERPSNLSDLELEQYDILLEEQAYPFEEQAIGLHEINMKRSWDGIYDEWVKRSFEELGRLMPSRFDKQEIEIAYVESIH